jgi:hypothetical protein
VLLAQLGELRVEFGILGGPRGKPKIPVQPFG